MRQLGRRLAVCQHRQAVRGVVLGVIDRLQRASGLIAGRVVLLVVDGLRDRIAISNFDRSASAADALRAGPGLADFQGHQPRPVVLWPKGLVGHAQRFGLAGHLIGKFEVAGGQRGAGLFCQLQRLLLDVGGARGDGGGGQFGGGLQRLGDGVCFGLDGSLAFLAFDGDTLQERLGTGIERAVGHAQRSGIAGQTFGFVALAPAEQLLGLFHQDFGAAPSGGVGRRPTAVLFGHFFVLADQGFDFGGRVVVEAVADIELFGLLDQRRGLSHVAGGQRTARIDQQRVAFAARFERGCCRQQGGRILVR